MMFDVPENSKVDTTLPVITDNYTILLYDEFPMLFIGSNQFGNNIVGSLMCEDEERDIFRYLYLVVTPKDYTLFISKKLSYLGLIQKQESIFLLDKTFEEEVLTTYNIPASLIPEKFLPLSTVFNPSRELVFSSNFLVSLKGQMADMHEALAERVVILTKGINQIFTTLSDILKGDNIEPEITQLAYTPTSFGFNYKVTFKTKKNKSMNLFFNQETANEFLTKSIDYSLNYLSSEVDKIKEGKLEGTSFHTMIEEPLAKLYLGSIPPAVKEKAIKNLMKIPYDMEKITDQLGMGFNYIEFNSIGTADKQSQIGVVDSDSSQEFDVARSTIETGEDVENEDVFKNRDIHIYHLNIISRKGNAHIKNTDKDDNEIMDSPKIEILGNKPLDGSEFINSMDTGRYINVRTKARKVKGRYKLLVIDF